MNYFMLERVGSVATIAILLCGENKEAVNGMCKTSQFLLTGLQLV